MADIYPLSRQCRFEGFPARIRVICGRAFSEARAAPYSFGSRVTLSRTPQSGVLAGTLTPGEALPELAYIYSDTGDDDVFGLKVSHYGYGRFYLPTTAAAFYALTVIKGVRVEAASIKRSFETVDVWATQIPAATDLTDPGVASGQVWTQDTDAASGSTFIWFTGPAPQSGKVVPGRQQLGGDVYIQI
jgi:hypothetical protein